MSRYEDIEFGEVVELVETLGDIVKVRLFSRRVVDMPAAEFTAHYIKIDDAETEADPDDDIHRKFVGRQQREQERRQRQHVRDHAEWLTRTGNPLPGCDCQD